MLGQNHSASMEMVERLYSGLSTFQDLRAKHRARANRNAAPTATITTAPPAAPTAASPPAVATSVVSPVTSPPANGAQVIAFVSVQGRVLPVYEGPGGTPEATAQATSAPATASASAPPAADTSASPAANTKPSPAPTTSVPPPANTGAPPTPTSAQPVPENPVPRTPHASATIALDPPKPPAVIRAEDRTEAHEQILAQHRTLLAEQERAAEERSAAVLRDVLADHRRLLEDAAERNRQQFAEHRTMLADQVRAAEERSAAILRDVLADHRRSLEDAAERHRQQFAELLAQHRTELHGASVARAEEAQATADLRALIAEQARVMQETHVRLSEQTAEQSRVMQETHVRLSEQTTTLTDATSILGETVFRLTIAYFSPETPSSAPSSGPTNSATPDDKDDKDDKADTAASPAGAPAVPPAPFGAASPAPPSIAEVPATPRPTASMMPAPPREAPQITTELNSATPPARRVCGVATPVASSIHSILADLDPTSSTPTPRQIKAQEEASNQRRVYEDLVDCDDEFFADVVDPGDAPDKPEPLA